MERKWTDIKYHVQDNSDVSHKDVKIYWNTNKFPALTFCGPHLHFDPKLGNSVCEICRIPCACVACTSILDRPLISGIPPNKQE